MSTAAGSLKYFSFKALLQQQGWISPAYVGVDQQGTIQYLSNESPQGVAIESVNGYALPGFQNAHSHAFQYAMAGMAEQHAAGTNDDFWSWREAMYQCALSMNPDQMESIATMLYAEMLRKGYTSVAEFHYLHHDKDGKPYNNLAEMGERLVSAADTAGIKITLIPVFYQKGGFGKPFQPRQRRFISKTVDEYFNLLDDSAHVVANRKNVRLGFSVHSLRAVDADDIIRTWNEGPATAPFHLHAAEQVREVEDSIAFLKQRPIEWLLDHLPVDERFNIVHCTHMTDNETTRLALSKANAVLCPGTEGNLGDGIFRLADFSTHGGNLSIGTDSHISLNPIEDIRWLDYAQRFISYKRNTFDDGARVLVNKSIQNGRSAMGYCQQEFFEIGGSLDAVIYSGTSPTILQSHQENLLSAIVYTADPSDILGTLVNGDWMVKENHHRSIDRIRTKFQQAVMAIRKK